MRKAGEISIKKNNNFVIPNRPKPIDELLDTP